MDRWVDPFFCASLSQDNTSLKQTLAASLFYYRRLEDFRKEYIVLIIGKLSTSGSSAECTIKFCTSSVDPIHLKTITAITGDVVGFSRWPLTFPAVSDV